MEPEEEITDEQPKKSRASHLMAFQYKKGQSGNPGGRPIGSVSMKTYVKNKLLSMSDEEREEFLEGLDKKTIWEMAEDKPKQGMDASVKLTISDVLDTLDGSTSEGQELEDKPSLPDQK